MTLLETFTAALVYCLSGVAILLLLVLLVYLFTVLLDRLSCLNSSTDVLTPYELEERRTATSLMKRAGIAGILAEERVKVFRSFFEKRAMPYRNTTNDEGEAGDNIEAQKAETTSCADDDEHNDPAMKTVKTDANGTENVASNENNTDTENENDADKTCPICLNQYDDGEKVMTGTLCSHMFHFECCMQWIEKANDHCPYCREDMMTPEELLAAAKEEIGDERIAKMVRINQDAARRLAAMQEGELLQNTTGNELQQVPEGADADAAQTESIQQMEQGTNNFPPGDQTAPRSSDSSSEPDIDDSEDPVASATETTSELHTVSDPCTHGDSSKSATSADEEQGEFENI